MTKINGVCALRGSPDLEKVELDLRCVLQTISGKLDWLPIANGTNPVPATMPARIAAGMCCTPMVSPRAALAAGRLAACIPGAVRIGQLGAAEQLRQRIPYLVGGDGWPKVLRAPLIKRLGGSPGQRPTKREPQLRFDGVKPRHKP
ncbi:hypothetical protein PSJM300_18260 [Stutzerimonas stutzeri DSM 10701]|uniref:Uncharacterized protein n=1 Tax=Stutzerimonas nitrititolerans TaxID=2482751 RepID=A0ABX9VA64_9GAMM|nr:hypothetical protein PSJM300_18260 [Stutzerimonas stutzeri DSM 10701]RMI03063.1 hypothetical protein EA795_00950 [Stutzerimonas nitrititolerans]SUD86230.1 Uncharacterised protein [Stutzerimonas stutzeri]